MRTAILLPVLLIVLGCDEKKKQDAPSYGNMRPSRLDPAVAEMEAVSAAISARVDEIFKAIHEGQVQRVYESFTHPRFREVASLQQFAPLCDRVKTRLGPLRSKQASQFEINPIDGSLVASGSYHAVFEHGSGTVFVVFQKTDNNWLLLRLNVNAPELLDDPATFQQPTELYVENSEPVLPGTMVDLLDVSVEPAKVVLSNVRVESVRWKISDPGTPLKAPAKGFVTIVLKADQVTAMKSAKSPAVRSHK